MRKRTGAWWLPVMAVALFAAVSANAVEITYWCPFSGGDGEFMKEMVDKFNASQSGIQVKMLNLKSEEYYAKFRTAAMSGRGPDVAIAHISQLDGLLKDNIIVPLDAEAAAAGIKWDSFAANAEKAVIIDGKHMAVPLDTHTIVFYFNKKLVRDAGLLGANGYPVIEGGADGFIKFMDALKAKLPADASPFAMSTEGAICYWLWWSYFAQQDGKLFAADGKSVNIDSQQGLAALKFMNELVENGYWPKGVKRGGEVFKNQKAATIVNGIWAVGDFGNTPNLEFGLMPLPRIFATQKAWADAHTFALVKQRNPDAEKQKACLVFANWMTENSLIWAKAGQIPAKSSVVNSQEFLKMPYRETGPELLKIADFLPNSVHINSIRETCMMYINATIVGQQQPAPALQKIQADVNKLLAK